MNHVGLWSGDIWRMSGNTGLSQLIRINNIFDARQADPTTCKFPVNWPRRFGLPPVAFRSSNAALALYDLWCEGRHPAPGAFFDQLKPTFTGTTQNYTALRYALEHYPYPPFSPVPAETNLQSFLVVVEDE